MSDGSIAKRRQRSPAYPALPLKEALERAGTLLDHGGKHPLPLDAAGEIWGYTANSSGLFQTVSALKQYGLLNDSGSKEDRTVTISALAKDIHYGVEGSSEQQRAIHVAALKPKIFDELWKMHGGELPQNDAPIRSFLIRQKEFNPLAVDGFITNFRETISFANLIPGDTIEESEKEVSDDAIEVPLWSQSSAKPTTGRQPFKKRTMQAGMKQDVFSLDEGPVVLEWPDRLSEASAEDMMAWLELIGKKVERTLISTEINRLLDLLTKHPKGIAENEILKLLPGLSQRMLRRLIADLVDRDEIERSDSGIVSRQPGADMSL